MKTRTEYYLFIFGFLVLGMLFLFFGYYAFSSYLSGGSTNPELLIAFAGSIIVAFNMLWQALKWTRTPEKSLTSGKLKTCPFCGAILDKDATLCMKCGRHQTE